LTTASFGLKPKKITALTQRHIVFGNDVLRRHIDGHHPRVNPVHLNQRDDNSNAWFTYRLEFSQA
jgi:hypothetical protein